MPADRRRAREAPSPSTGGWARRGSALTLLLLAGLVLLLYRDYGITWDEGAQSDYGRRILRWFGTLFRDGSAATHGDLVYYGGLFEVVAELTARLAPGDRYETRHLVNGLVGLLAVLAAQRIGCRLAGPTAGLLSGLFLVLTPRFFGHLFNNPKDVPFAAFSTLALWAMLASWDALPRLSPRNVAAVGLAVGAALGVRAGGLVLLCHLLTLFAGWLLVRRRDVGGAARGGLAALAASFAAIAVVAWAVMLLFWPWAQTSPLTRPFEALRALLRTSGAESGAMLFDGREVVVGNLPWTYVPVWLAVSLPETYAVAVLAGLWLVARALLRWRPGLPSIPTVQVAWLTSVVALPIAAAVVTRPFLYDGVRHLLFVVPCLAVLAGVAADRFLRSDLPAAARTTAAVLLAASASLTAADMVRLHPYQSVYFNRLAAGGVGAASRRFETDYWGASYREGIEWLVRNHTRAAGEVRVTCAYVARPCLHYLRADGGSRFRYVSFEEEPDVVLSITRGNMHERFRGRVLHVVERMGAPLLYVVELRPGAAGRTGIVPDRQPLESVPGVPELLAEQARGVQVARLRQDRDVLAVAGDPARADDRARPVHLDEAALVADNEQVPRPRMVGDPRRLARASLDRPALSEQGQGHGLFAGARSSSSTPWR